MGYISKYISETASDISDEVIESSGNVASKLISDFFDGISEKFVDIRPNLDIWYTYLDKSEGESIAARIMEWSQYFGALILLILLFIYLIKIFVNPRSLTQKPLETIIKGVVAAIFIYCAPSIIDGIFDIADTLYTKVNYSGQIDFSKALAISNIEDLAGAGVAIVGITIACLAEPPLNALIIIIALIINWPIIRAFVKYLLETIERYIITVFVALFFPAAASTMILPETSNIFISWARTLGAQIFLLFINGIIIKSAVFLLLQKAVSTEGILGYLFILGFFNVVGRLDSVLQSMGLNIAQCVGSIGDSIAGAAHSLSRADNARQKAGNALKAIGAAQGNMGMFAAGSKLGVGSQSISKSGMPNRANIESDFVRQRAQMGLATSLQQIGGASSATSAVSRFMANPMANMRTMSGMSQEAVNKGVQGMVVNAGLSGVSNASLNRDGSANFKAIGSDGIERDYNLSSKSTDASLSLKDSEGKDSGFYLNSRNTMGNGDVSTGSGMFEDAGAMGLEDELRAQGVDSAFNDDGIVTFKAGEESIATVDNKGNRLSAHDLMNQDICDQLNDDVKKLYPGSEFARDEDGNEKGFSVNGNTVSASIKLPGSDNYHTIYAQDAVKRDTVTPSEYGSKKSICHHNDDGTSYRTIYKMDNKKNRVEKK